MVGLANVDNTTDALKPISTATQTALNLKAPLASPTFTGTVVLPDNTITNAMLAGSIANAKLANSSITINGNAVSLGGTVTLATGQAATESTLGTVYGKVTLAGVDNTSLGSLTFQNTETGILNTAIGNESLRTLSSGERNTVVGYQAGTLIETGSDNTLLGTGAGNTLLSGVNNIIIGSNAQAATNSTSNEIIIGNGSITTFKIPGIGLVASATDYIITATAAQNLTNKTITSPTIISPIFQGPISVFSPTDDSHAINRGYLVAELADAVGSDIIPLDSLSQLFDGYTSRFRLKFNGATFDPTNPYKLLITINGIIQILGNQDQHWPSLYTIRCAHKCKSMTNQFFHIVRPKHYISIVTAGTFTNTGVGLKPYSPAHFKAVKQTNGDFILSWIRRTRYNGSWLSFSDVPLNEEREEYTLNIYNGPTIVRTTIVSSPTFTYTAAMQITDFGSVQSTITSQVAQNSATIGPGYYAAI